MSKRTIIAVGISALALAVAFPGFLRARRKSASLPGCYLNLLQIDSTKDIWMNDNGKSPNEIPTWEDLRPYFRDSFIKDWGTNARPTCPAGGTYVLGRAGERVRCSVGGQEHRLP